MKSRISCCNGAVLKKNLFRGIPVWGLYLLCWLVAMPMMILSEGEWHDQDGLAEYVLQIAAHAGDVVAFFYGLVAAFVVFSHLYKSRSANFFAALPLRRETMFLTCYLSGLLYAVVPHLIVAVLTVLVGSFWGAALFSEAVIWFCAMGLNFLFYYSFAALIALIVGSAPALPLIYAVLNFTAVVVEAIFRSLLDTFIYGYYFNSDLWLDWASPLFYTMIEGNGPNVNSKMGDGVLMYHHFEGWGILLIMGVVGLVFAAAAFLLYRNRRMEAAGDVIAVRCLRPVFLYCFTVGCSLVLGYVLASLLASGIGTTDFIPVTVCMLVGAFLGYFSGQMMLQKSLRVFRKCHWLRFGIVCLCILAVLLGARFDLTGYAGYVPEEDEIESVSVRYADAYSEDLELIAGAKALHEAILEQREDIERAHPDAWYKTFQLNYRLKNGTIVSREYELPVDNGTSLDTQSLIRQYEALLNDPDYIVLRSLPQGYTVQDIEMCLIHSDQGEEVYLTRQEAYEFLKNVLEADLRDSSMERVNYSAQPISKDSGYTGVYVEPRFTDTFAGRNSQYYFFSIPADAWRTLEFAEAHGVKPTVPEE